MTRVLNLASTIAGLLLFSGTALAVNPTLTLPAIDAEPLRSKAHAAAAKPGVPLAYGKSASIDTVNAKSNDANQHGEWTQLADGSWRYRLEIHAPGAVGLDFGFDDFYLPHGAKMVITNPSTSEQLGTWTDADNQVNRALWTAQLIGKHALIDITVPADKRDSVSFKLVTVNRAFSRVDELMKTMKASGSCNVDVACSLGDNWRNEINSAVHYTFARGGGSYVCSGTFMNTTASQRQYVMLTAGHCISDPTSGKSVLAYFKYQNSYCRRPGSSSSGADGDGPKSIIVAGSEYLASASGKSGEIAGTDFSVIRFTRKPPQNADIYYSGWDSSGTAPTTSVAIHHPGGFEKRISINRNPATITNYGSNFGGSTHFRIADWDEGTTEQGSSGSGLWNQNRHVVGILSGGVAACGNNEPDWYGRLSVAWNEGRTSNRRLKDWLDPANTGKTSLAGSDGSASASVKLESPAFASQAVVGDAVTFTASTSVKNPKYQWDTDGDGVFERTTTDNSIQVSYPFAGDLNVRVRVVDEQGGNASDNKALKVVGPSIIGKAVTTTEVCGDGDNVVEPGERWVHRVRLTNQGQADLKGGSHAQFSLMNTAYFRKAKNSGAPVSLTDLVLPETSNKPSAKAGTIDDVALEKKTFAINGMGKGQSLEINVPFYVDTKAKCGASYFMFHPTTANETQASMDEFDVGRITIGNNGQCDVVQSCAANIEQKAMTPGIYFNQKRSGNGLTHFNYAGQNGAVNFGGIWYTGTSAHNPAWHIISGAVKENVEPFSIDTYRRSPSSGDITITKAGFAWHTVIDSQTSLVTWSLTGSDGKAKMRSELMSRFNVPASTPNRTEQWAPEKGGNWGIVFDTMKLSADTPYFEFTGLYFYDVLGNPVWATSSTRNPKPEVYADGMLVTQPHCPACPKYLNNTENKNIGIFYRGFESNRKGLVKMYLNLSNAGLQGNWTQEDITINALAAPKE